MIHLILVIILRKITCQLEPHYYFINVAGTKLDSESRTMYFGPEKGSHDSI